MSIRLNAAATPMSIRLKANGGTASLRLAQGRTGPPGPAGPPGGADDNSIATVVNNPTSQTHSALSTNFVHQAERPAPFPQERLAYSKGGVVGTNGRAPVALRFDDWQDDIISLGLIDELNNRGLFGSIVLCTDLGSNPWNQTITWDTLRTWNRDKGMEMWSHGTDHNTPYDADPATFTANLRREIIDTKATIESQGMRCMGWAMPGVGFQPDGVTGGYGSFLMKDADWDTEAGRLLQATYGLVEADQTDRYRHLPGGQRFGLGHWTVSDGKTLQASKDVLDGAINLGLGVEFMCHAGNLGGAGNITVAQFLEFLDYIVTKRDAGLVEFVTPSTLPFCDPARSRRLDLIGNGDLTQSVPTSSTTVIGNWRNVDGTNRYVTNVADGPQGGAQDVLHMQGSTLVNQVVEKCTGRGLSGQTVILDAWVRCTQVNTVTTSSVRFLALDVDNSARLNRDQNPIPVTTTWQRLRIPFAIPVDTDTLSFGFGRGSTVGSGQVEWANVHIYVA